ncbi:SNF2 family N-terminal domain-domain-containing protein [Leucosporidium creatinivorum]|uniref:SNF2 family N-terminal domain-domain-containing protein n=1 Tax=Leucosporidium creatinivorum TaxID=106004 RepID=A0A1Y2EZ48_9BASI|nr:SNF2 family N-terminal domain-domain-containing protein [Leucosporidium creatinivorum]
MQAQPQPAPPLGATDAASASPGGANLPLLQHGGVPITSEHLRKLLARMQSLRQEGHTAESNNELANITKLVMRIQNHHQKQRQQQQHQQQQQQQQQANGATPSSSSVAPPPTTNGSATNAPNSNGDLAAPSPPRSPPVVNFTPEQLASLKCQIMAFKMLSRNLPVPPAIQAAIYSPAEALKYINANGQAGDAVGAAAAGEPLDANGLTASEARELREKLLAEEPPLEEVEDPKSLVYPYNAFIHPKEVLHHSQGGPTRRTLLIPTLLPPGLDPTTLAAERNRFIQARVQQRIQELESFPANMAQDDPISLDLDPSSSAAEQLASQKLRALIELKSLNLLAKQRALREDVVRGFNQASSLALPSDRTNFRRSKKQTLRDARLTEQLERKQKTERERRAKQKHLDHLNEIVNHGHGLVTTHKAHQAKFVKLGKALQKFHVDAEKDEQRRVERVSKERLKALRADDEEGYLKLIDTAKDTRITHLLRQTDAFLDSLATAVVAQQESAIVAAKGPKSAAVAEEEAAAGAEGAEGMQVDGAEGGGGEDEPSGESRFGAQPVFEEEAAKDKVDYYNVAHRVKETVSVQPSILIGGELKAYQLKGLEWMVSLYNNHVNGILADEMGLGKTIQTLSLITFLIESKKQNGPYLVIVPLSTMPNWISEFEKWAPSVKMVSYKGTPNQRKEAQNQIRAGNFQVLLTTYEYIIKDRPLLAKIKWLHMIIDEGHRMKNAQSKLSITLTTYYSSRYRLILTGTPLQNNLPELWALLNFVLPKIFGSVKSFDEWFNAPFANTGGQDKIEINEEESLLVIRRLHKVLRPFLLRRLKKDVESDLPDKVERVIKCRMSSLQLKLTRQIKEHGMIFTELGPSEGKQKATGIKGLQNQIMQLRKICNHPFCFEAVERSIDPTGASDATLFRVAGKFEILDRILPKLFATGHRVLMFFQMTTVMTIFEDYLNFRRIKHLRLDGTTKHEDRSDLLKKFNNPQSEYPIFILSTRAGGLGLNLQTADTVIIFDSDWNPHQDLQAQDRAHRIGQKKEVRILRLVTERSVEEQVMAGASRKIEMDKKVIQAGRYDNKSTAEERDEYLRALLEVDDEEVEEDDGVDEAEQLNEAIARSEEERAIFTKMDRDRRAAEEHAWAAAGNPGKMPERLIQEYELPEVYRMEHVKKVEQDELADGARRSRNQVTYDDGMSEEQWLQTMEEDDDDPTTRRRPTRGGRPKKPMIDRLADSDSDSAPSGRGSRRATAVLDSDDDEGPSRGRNKRARQSVGASSTASSDGSESDDSRTGQGKRRKVQLSPYQERMKAVFDECIDVMEELDNPTMGHQCTGLFNALPAKRDYPDYYVLIRQPISLKEIKKKISSGLYPGPQAFEADMHLMLANAMVYNEAGSVRLARPSPSPFGAELIR